MTLRRFPFSPRKNGPSGLVGRPNRQDARRFSLGSLFDGFCRGGCRGLGGSIGESCLLTFFGGGLGEEGVCSSVYLVISDAILLLAGLPQLDLTARVFAISRPSFLAFTLCKAMSWSCRARSLRSLAKGRCDASKATKSGEVFSCRVLATANSAAARSTSVRDRDASSCSPGTFCFAARGERPREPPGETKQANRLSVATAGRGLAPGDAGAEPT